MKLTELLQYGKLLAGAGSPDDLPNYILDQFRDFALYLAMRWDVPLNAETIKRDVRWALEQTLRHGSPAKPPADPEG